jgi:hypothetical protein
MTILESILKSIRSTASYNKHELVAPRADGDILDILAFCAIWGCVQLPVLPHGAS